ncbi:sulfur carrier protein ThiS [Acidiferrobacter thiooxydans]|uniref:Thiamine biosynthesis protein ThiS n=1 Tax=Acidiferrobacter thiooxydans TaxID=163359 RepID=A0A1C2G2A9_9GAMM|nr:sulfur carrier protein ThiS [Acidiferrobacter thiooxydans]RCN58240.1 thiamine biosynthesis protein ThiS [Acidiferrobacter thiooxydans]UEO01322.1 sulfur carrier protein ThiS [Acidiferrobacter thiooxydans]
MQIYVNGTSRTVPEPIGLMALLLEMGLVGKRIAVEINHEIVPRTQQGDRILRDGDRIEIVQAIGGG